MVDEYFSRVLARNKRVAEETGRQPRFYIRTFGCQMNVRESEQLSGMLSLMGYAPAADEENADLVLYNTCCIRDNAENKIFGNLSYLKFLKQANKNLTVVFCGCLAQKIGRHENVDVLFGTRNHARFSELLWRYMETGLPVADISWNEYDSASARGNTENPECMGKQRHMRTELEYVTTNPALLTSRGHKYKCGINIIYGCDNFCAYCIVPHVRGRERSRPADDILNEIQALVNDGVKEIMLLGQNVNSYGPGGGTGFHDLLRMVNAAPGLERVRFMTSHPKDFTDEIIAAVRDCEKVCKSVHLPLQSGSTRILKLMNRRYTKEDYINLAERLYAAIPGVALSTDIIVGFPGETEEDFNETLDVVERVRFAGAFTFLYSKRTGTPAAEMENTVPESVASERFKRLTEKINPFLLARNESFIGKTLKIMAEEKKLRLRGRDGTLTGRADDNTLTHFDARGYLIAPGDIVNVRITDAKTFYITGYLE